MTPSIPLRCTCGLVQGEILDSSRPASGNHLVCYCDDCQAFVAFLGREDVLDAQGGTPIFQTTPSQVRFTSGEEHIRSLRLSDKGMVRWYTDCCRTPIGNIMPSPRSPFVGVITRFVAGDEQAKQASLGPIIRYVQGKFAIGGCPPHADNTMGAALLPRLLWFLGGSLLKGKHKPSPFLKAGTEEWLSEPQVLTPAERAGLARG